MAISTQFTTMSELPALTDSTFESQIQTGWWVVEFWSPTCSPCRIVSPALAELALEFSDQVQFGAVNIDEAVLTALQQHVMGVPAVLVYHDGEPQDVMFGSYPQHVYRSRILALLNRVSA